jgi:two-component system sensor histidine kinase/response regulator
VVVMMENSPKILIIDDEEVILDSCAQVLEGRGYQISTATNGTLGLNLVKEIQPDLVYVDLKMPGISGLEVLEEIHEFDPTIVSVVITGYATVSSAVDAMKRGAFDFLPKPFTPDELRLITVRALDWRKLVLETIALRREKELLRDNFAAIVSHELKTPLGAIQQNLYVLITELSGKLNEKQENRLERMKIRIEDLIKLLNSWLRVISVDISKISESFTEISVLSALTKAVESVEPYAVRKDIEILQSVEQALPPIAGDEVSLVEALVNILGNAVKYSYPVGKISINAIRAESRIVITISDNGVGISREDLPLIFDDFYRGRPAQEGVGGAGIGLAISRRIIEAHQGTITAESEPGKGTIFTISLPVSAAVSNSPSA